jgi:hypothetical protein
VSCVHVERFEFNGTIERGQDQVRSLEHADALTPTQRTFLDETSKSTHSLV